MPKRKRTDDYEELLYKFKKLEKKIRRRCRSRSRSPDRSEPEERHDHTSNGKDTDDNVARLLGGNLETEAEIHDDNVNQISPPATIPAPESSSTAPVTVADSAAKVDAAIPSTSSVQPDQQASEESSEVVLADEIMDILGEDPTISSVFGPEIHKDLAIRLEHTALHGLSKENRKDFNGKYLIPENCKLIDAPALNAEIKAAISDIAFKRDKGIETRQKQVATAISCLGHAINKLLAYKNPDSNLVKMLMDTERILCDCQHTDSVTRRNFILSSLKRDLKDQLQNTKPDSFLFGQNFSETIKTAKAINRSGADLKTPTAKPQANSFKNSTNKKQPSAANTSKHLNWRGPYPTRKPPNRPKTKEPAPNRNRQFNSSRPSQKQRTRDRH